MLEISDMLQAVALSMLSAVGAAWFLTRIKPVERQQSLEQPEPFSLLFDGGILHHGTSIALSQLALQPGTHIWDDMRDSLLPRFPEIPEKPGAGKNGSLTIPASDQSSLDQLRMRWRDGLCWVEIENSAPQDSRSNDHSDSCELDDLRRVSAALPHPVWQEDQAGKVFWYNGAYAALFRQAYGKDVDPAKRLFSDGDEKTPARVSFRNQTSKQTDWYELSVNAIGGVTIFHATCINAVVAAEQAQRNFVQTLAKTFAHLSIGLVIFDRNGQLALFNPALVDLTGLPPHFLSARPTMLSFFDQLRENRRMPEPKNYANWRQEIAEVSAAATDGRYQETWTLESGQTYRVKGRPHPDGATAFLIEDISAEIALTRNYRAELELSQSLLDSIDDGLAVFSASGVLTFSNAAYRELWQHRPDASFADVTILDALAVWQSQSEENPHWQTADDFIKTFGTRKHWDMPIHLKNGQMITCQIIPITSGATLLRFKASTHFPVPVVNMVGKAAE